MIQKNKYSVQTKKLSEICFIEIGKTPSRANKKLWDLDKQTDNVWLSIADLANAEGKKISDSKEYISNEGKQFCKIVKSGTLLVSFKLTLGRLAIAGKDLFTNEAIAALVIKNEREVSRDFLYYFFHFFDWNEACKGDTKVKGKTLNKAKLKEIKIPLPPLPEQLHFVSILDEALEKLEQAKGNIEKNQQNAKDIFESYLYSIFTNPGEFWEEKTLKEVSLEFGRGKSKHRPRNDKKLYGGDYPFIQTGEVRNAGHLIEKYSQTYNEIGLMQSKLWPKGTICITIAANIAETGILNFDACFPDSIIGLVVDPKKASGDFVEYLLYFFKTRIQLKSKGSAQANINLATFENEKFPFPNITEQSRIVANLNAIRAESERIESNYVKKLKSLEELRKSILQEAFL